MGMPGGDVLAGDFFAQSDAFREARPAFKTKPLLKHHPSSQRRHIASRKVQKAALVRCQ
jgi:hypothetical protein